MQRSKQRRKHAPPLRRQQLLVRESQPTFVVCVLVQHRLRDEQVGCWHFRDCKTNMPALILDWRC